MKKPITILAITIIFLFSCNKKNTITPLNSIEQVNQIIDSRKFVEIYVTYGGVNNFCSVKWAYNPDVDSGYVSTNTNNRTIKNYTNSDSILVYTNSYDFGEIRSNTVTVYVNGRIKEQYSGMQVVKTIKLN